MKTFTVMMDLLREARNRKWFLALGIGITLLHVLLFTSLKLDVVDGALAATRLFGNWATEDIQPVDVALRPVFAFASQAIFYGGMLFGILACADFGPSLLSPGRIEHLLALPVRRWELLLGTFLGVLVLAMMASLYGAGGLTVVLGIKGGFWTWRPLVSALLAGLGFSTVYAGMLVTALYVRSASLSAFVGIFLFLSGLLASYRDAILPVFSRGVGRSLFAAYTSVMPRVGGLAQLSAEIAGSGRIDVGRAAQLLAGFVVFTLAALALGVWRFEQRDF